MFNRGKLNKYKTILMCLGVIYGGALSAHTDVDKQAVEKVALDYIESQHVMSPQRMDNALHPEMKKRTYWKKADGSEFVMETSRELMLKIAKSYNSKGDKFPKKPRKEVHVLDIDGRVATVKLVADEWIDYMHLFKNENNEWKVINVLWQYHDQSKHKSQK